MKIVDHSVIKVSELPKFTTGHSQLQFVATPDDTGSRSMTMMQGTVKAGGNVPLHSHADPECFFVLEGEIEVYQDRDGVPEWILVRKGEFAIMHSTVKHAWRNRASAPCVCLIVTGANVFRFLRGACEMQESAERGETPPQELGPKLLMLAKSTRCWLATPGENAAIGL